MLNKKGIILIACYLVIVALLILGSALLARSISERRVSETERTAIQAFWLAEAGIQSAIWELNYGGSTWSGWNTSGNPYTKTILSSGTGGLSTGDINIYVLDPTSNTPIIQAIGYAPGVSASVRSRKTLQIKLQRSSSPMFTKALFAEGQINISGSAVIDSYDSDDGSYGGSNLKQNGEVGSNGTSSNIVKLTGSVIVRGDVSTGPSGTIKKTGSIQITGDETHNNNITLSPPTVPSALTGLTSSGELELSGSSTQTLSSGDYKFSEIDLSGSSNLVLEGSVRIYITGEDSLESTGSSRITINGDVEIYMDGDAKIAGSGVVNQNGIPSDFYLYGTPTCEEIKWSGSSSLFGGIYAPRADIKFSGSTNIFGSVVGNTIDVSGSATFHYDEALETSGPSLGGGGSSFQPMTWQEQ